MEEIKPIKTKTPLIPKGRMVWISVGVVLIAWILLLWYISQPVSAYTYVLAQGDTAYIGDTVDMSLVVAWPDYQLALCDGDYACDNPTIVDTSMFNQHHVFLDRTKWKTGVYYRWDGKWNRGENQDAFTIATGVRPSNETVFETLNTTTKISEVVMPAKPQVWDQTNIIIARGDSGDYHYSMQNTSVAKSAYLWLFGGGKLTDGSMILGEKMRFRSNDSVFSYSFPYNMTQDLSEGDYTGYIQLSGENGQQDVFYRPEHKINGNKHRILDTLYDDDVIPDVPLEGFIPSRIQSEFANLENITKLCDDILIPINMSVMQPSLSFAEYYEDGDTLIISGKTTMSEGSIIVVKLDPAQYALKYDIMKHTWSTTAVGGVDKMRTFNISVPIDWSETAIGNHVIYASVDKYNIHAEVFKDFKVTDTFVMPTPTPVRERVIVEEYGWHRVTPTPEPTEAVVTAITVIPTQLPLSSNITQQNASVNVSQAITVTQTPMVTTKVAAQGTLQTIPVSPMLGLVALVLMGYVWRKLK